MKSDVKLKVAEYEQIVLIAEDKNKDAFSKVLKNWKEKLRGLKDINWNRNNSEWEGRLLLNGRMLKTTLGVELAANTILKKCGIPLSEDRLKHENRS